MSRYLHTLVQRAAGRGPWAAVAPVRAPLPAVSSWRPPGARPTLDEGSAPGERRGSVAQARALSGTAVPVQAPESVPLPRVAPSIRRESPSGSATPVSAAGAQASAPGAQSATASIEPLPSAGMLRPPAPAEARQAQAAAQEGKPASSANVQGPTRQPTRIVPAPTVASDNSQPAPFTASQPTVNGGEPEQRDVAAARAKPDSQPLAPHRRTASVAPAVTVAPPLPKVSVNLPTEGDPSAPANDGSPGRGAARLQNAPAPPTIPGAEFFVAPGPVNVVPARPNTVPVLLPPTAARQGRRAAGANPAVQVRIGRVEVRAAPTSEPLPPAAPAGSKVYGFDEYLSLRSYSRGD